LSINWPDIVCRFVSFPDTVYILVGRSYEGSCTQQWGYNDIRIHGNLSGLKPNQLKQLKRLSHRRLRPPLPASREFVTRMTQISRQIRRLVGVLVDRKGIVTHVIVGDHQRIYLPDIGRARAGSGRFRGIRYLRSNLGGALLTQEDLTDLSRLRLDLVASFEVDAEGYPARISWAHLLPKNQDGKLWETHQLSADRWFDMAFDAFIRDLEEEFGRRASTRVKATRERSFLISARLRGEKGHSERLDEMHELCRTADVEIAHTYVSKMARYHPRTVIGPGKLEEIVQASLQHDVDLLVFDHDLRPGQLRAIAESTELKVIDRTQLILDIFARRAKTAGGKLQVELAQLKYMLPRLTTKDDALSRLTGGIGGRGPGETKLEINRRRARDRVAKLEGDICKLSHRRSTRRKLRNQRQLPVVAIVGYTNAGKSTLLNTLTGSQVFTEDAAFATLDPTSRRLRFPSDHEIIVTDTVGFIRDLPPDILRAFGATLEELEDACLLLHVVDLSSEHFEERMKSVQQTLRALQLEERPQLLVFNKTDRMERDYVANQAARYGALPISALEQETTRPLVEAIRQEVFAVTA